MASARCLSKQTAVMARRRRRRRPGGHTTAVGSGGRSCPLLYRYRLTHTYCSLARLPHTHPFVGAPILQRHFQVQWRARLPPTRVLFPHTCIYVGVVECAPASPYKYSSSTHRFPDERTPIEAMPLSATSTELGLGWGLGLGLDSLSQPLHTPPRTRSPSSRHPPFTH